MVGWERKKIEDCTTFYNGIAHENIVSNIGNYILITSRCISTELKDYRTVTEQLFPLYVDDIVMVMSDIPNGKALAKCLLIDKNDKYTLNQRICCFRGHKEDTRYLFYQLNRNECFLGFNDGYNQTNLRKTDILNCEILVPPISEQHRIAAVLTDTDELITTLERLIAKKKSIKQGAMQELLTGKRRLAGVSEEWVQKKLGDVCEIKDGTHQTPTYVDFGIPFYSVENVTNDDFSNTKYITPAEHRKLTAKYKIECGDILMTRIGSIGVCKYVDWEVNASFYVSLALLKCKSEIDSKFLCLYSQCTQFQKEIELHSLQHAVPKKINLGNISLITLLIPSTLEEQRAIAEILSDMDKEIDKLTAKLKKYKQIKQGMMSELLTGRIRLTEEEDNG
jgi:type I restriction enzyme S subunit